MRQCCVPEGERTCLVLIDYLGGRAREEVLCQPEEVRRDFGGPGVCAAATVWAVGHREVVAREVLYADAVEG